MDEDRKARYLDKIFWIRGRVELISIWLSESSDTNSIPDTKTVLAIFKAFQEITEASMDLIAMHLRDSGIPPRDDYSNIEKISELSTEQKQLLKEMNGLRNRIIHRYNGTDEHVALSGISESLPNILSLIKIFEKWTKKI